jgi:hypothetical protein
VKAKDIWDAGKQAVTQKKISSNGKTDGQVLKFVHFFYW